jgi:hypothetical protein
VTERPVRRGIAWAALAVAGAVWAVIVEEWLRDNYYHHGGEYHVVLLGVALVTMVMGIASGTQVGRLARWVGAAAAGTVVFLWFAFILTGGP